MSSDLCINGHEIAVEFRFCITCGAGRPDSQDVEEDRIVITLEGESVFNRDELSGTPGSIGFLTSADGIDEDSKQTSEVIAQTATNSIYEKRLLLDKARDEAYEEVAALESVKQELADWEARNTHSFLARASATMNQNLTNASSMLDQYSRIVESLRIPEPGTMAKLRKTFHRKLLWQNIIIILIAFLIYRIPRLPDRDIQKFFKFAQPSFKVLFLCGFILSTFLFVAALITYYRGWSTYQRKVITTLWQLQTVARNAENVRNEQGRLKSLYPQVNEWLIILGHSLTNPWRIRKEWFESSIGELNEDSLPNSLRISQAHEDDGPAMLGMQRYAAERFMSRGWRAKVFADQVDVIRESLGLPKDRLDVDTLDQDILYSPNGPRALIRKNIEELEILESVGRRQLLPLIKEVQKEAITKSRPPVNEIRKKQIETTKTAAEDELKSDLTPWDEFLSFALPVNGKPRTPLSVFSLSDSGKVASHHDRYKTFMIVPDRLKEFVHGVDDKQLHTYSESTKLPMDVVVRADFSGPIPAQDLLFLAKTAAQKAAIEEKEEKPKKPFNKTDGI
jgi:hypothetical protein